METVSQLIDFLLHLDRFLQQWCTTYGGWTYAILFAIIFCETGLVVTPFLPGDSLLFAAGAMSSYGLNPLILFLSLVSAAVIGDNVNYWIGRLVGQKLVHEDSKILKKKYVDRTHEFFERYGKSAIILARFVPIVRTFMPFVAGLGKMDYRIYLPFDIAGGVLWVGICVFAGYFFGSHEIVKKNFSLVALAIVFISILPGIIEFIRVHRRARAAK
ncbi:MAG: DedA family protein [Planctomycetes bacterium]|nr:DedA family protein [Planctomycetota bacterium]